MKENLESLVRLGEEPADSSVSPPSFHLAPGFREAELSDQVRWTTRAGLILLGPFTRGRVWFKRPLIYHLSTLSFYR